MWRALAALRSVLTVPFHGALGIIAGAYLAIARSGGALGAYRGHRDWARITNWALVLVAPVALHAAFDFPLLALQRIPDLGSTTRLLLGSASVLIGFSSIGFAIRLVHRLGKHHVSGSLLDLPRNEASVQLPAISCATRSEPTAAEAFRSPARSTSSNYPSELNRALSACLSTPHGKRVMAI